MSNGGKAAVAHVLIVDSHAADRENLRAQLAAAPFKVAVAATGLEARRRLSNARIDAVIVDPDLPDGDGFELVRGLAIANRPVFVVASSDDERLAEQAYASGATDFAYKPIARNELLARIKHNIVTRLAAAAAEPRLTLRREERTCVVDGREYALTRNERSFLACLVDAPRNFATYAELIIAVWGESQGVETQSLRVLAAQVRRKIERSDSCPVLDTVVGEGFKLNL